MSSHIACPGVVPSYLLARLAESGRYPRAAAAARQTLTAGRPPFRARIDLSIDENGDLVAELSDAPNRTISDAGNTQTLPGAIVRGEDDEPVADASVNEAFDGLGATFEMLLSAFGRNSLNDAGAPLDATVHYGTDYDNAFWDGERMVFGDGDGEVFVGFTASTTVIGHELAHGVVQYTANLEYQGQPGALNESIADVFGALTEQFLLEQSAGEATWLIGAEIFTDAVQGSALRSMIAPGTAYDDDELGKDPQPDHMSGFVRTTEDNGGVHINSGIPNRAFALFAIDLGGNAWEAAGTVWYRALTGGLSSTATFTEFADATVAAASAIDDATGAAARRAWTTVGVYADERVPSTD
ncbi:M4 family peptidase [Microbacterium foliorum]|jgi:Zn-dependent metalloprotease|uniref:Neutral metalloproteinase n=2 Tax=Bacillati TaxID=1783272 RepID=A0A0F0KHA5_9MICO|nr:M4 family metallopeptidase [Microbacterium foliorum]AXL10971.1 M4 family peptidase [Microbacterium foliorum]KJL20267.1 Protease PrtS precursor [Microbacterium foliorum]CAH0139740.1 Protease PrtS [Microbacterium foliorum]CAH0189128.1 Protease PrtS [Microbacterium foliorum]